MYGAALVESEGMHRGLGESAGWLAYASVTGMAAKEKTDNGLHGCTKRKYIQTSFQFQQVEHYTRSKVHYLRMGGTRTLLQKVFL